MGTYKNDYSKNEDELLWELYDIRHKLHKKWNSKSLKERNDEIKNNIQKKKQEWLKKRQLPVV
jgi:hypothetical protein